MRYVLYIDYRASYKPMYSEYRPMDAKTMAEAVIEADATHDPSTMYLIRIMEKTGKPEKVESDIKAQAYKAILEKRSTKWTVNEREHIAKHFIAKFGDWYDIA